MKSPQIRKCQCGYSKVTLPLYLQLILLILPVILLTSPVQAIIDQNGDGLDDIWQELFGAQNLEKDCYYCYFLWFGGQKPRKGLLLLLFSIVWRPKA